MGDALDLSGKEAPQEEQQKKKSHGAIKDRPGDASRIYTRVDRAERAWEKDLRERCERTQQRLVEWLQGRNDEELAEVIQEDGVAMIGGLIALCGQAAWLRAPLTGAMAVFEPLIAFGRLIRVLARRWTERRYAAAEEREWERAQAEAEAAAEASAEPPPPEVAEPWRVG